jgi:hypothetical protein
MRSDADRLQDVLEAIERIEKYAARGKAAFTKTSCCKPGYSTTY